MNFDVLLIVQYACIPDRSYYWVISLSAANKHAAGKKAKDRVMRVGGSGDFPLSHAVVSGVGPMGCYQRFIGKYVGQFIDEAFPERVKF